MTTYVKHKMCNVVSGSGKECDKPLGHKGMCQNKTGCIVTKWEKTPQSQFMVVDVECWIDIEWMQMMEMPYDDKHILQYDDLSFTQWLGLTSEIKVFSGTDM